MVYTIKLANGLQIEAKTAADAAAVVEELQKANRQSGAGNEPAGRDLMVNRGLRMTASRALGEVRKTPGTTAPTALIYKTLNFLKKIQQEGPVETSELTELLKTEHTRGVGAKVRPIKTLLLALGYEPDGVFYVGREGDYPATWEPGPFIGAAISDLERVLEN